MDQSSPPYYLDNTNNQTYHNSPGNHDGGYLPPRTPAQNIPGPRYPTQQSPTHVGYNNRPSSVGKSSVSSKSDPESKYSGGSISSYRPPSAQSGGYRLATGLTMDSDGEGYLAPRSSAGSSYQYQDDNRVIGPHHDLGVEIDHNNHQDNRSNSSDLSSKGSVNFNPAGPIGWPASEKPRMDPVQNGRPESIAYRGHDYEELPMKKDQYVYADVDDNVKSKVALPTQHESAGSQDNLTGSPSQYRRRQNPLYDAIVREDNKGSSKPAVAGTSRCLCATVIVFALLVVLALILALVAISGAASWAEDSTRTVYMVSTPSYAQLQQAMDRIDELESRYSDLLHKISLLEASEIGILITNLSNQNARLTQINSSVQEIRTDLSVFRTDIDDISKMPGPQGPSGVGNLSACENKMFSSGFQNGDRQFQTEWIPSAEDNLRFVVLGVDCSTTLAQRSFLEKRNSSGHFEYRCVCSGTTDSSSDNSRFCELNLWRCPRLS